MGKTESRRTLTYAEGAWHEEPPRVLGPGHHAMWLASVVFDGARSFRGVAPDLDLHCARVINSARYIGLDPKLSGPDIEKLVWDGIRQFPDDAELYICPIFYAESGFVVPAPESTQFVLAIHDSPLPEPSGFSAGLSSFRRPSPDSAPTNAKASCLYPNVARAVREANDKGFDTAVVLDPLGHVAEFAYTNLFIAKDGVVHTPAINETFLNGITRQRVIGLLRGDGVEVVERAIDFPEVRDADEVFATGNYAKVHPCSRIEDRHLQAGPLFRRARELYFGFAGGK